MTKIKNYIIVSFIIAPIFSFANSKILFLYGDTIIEDYKCYYKLWFNVSYDFKYYEIYKYSDSTIFYKYSLINDQLFGVKEKYNNDKSIIYSENFINNKIIGKASIYTSNKTLLEEGSYSYCSKNIEYRDTIVLYDSKSFEENTVYTYYECPKDGKWIYYSISGDKLLEGYYRNNIKVGTWYVYDSSTGHIIEEIKYSD